MPLPVLLLRPRRPRRGVIFARRPTPSPFPHAATASPQDPQSQRDPQSQQGPQGPQAPPLQAPEPAASQTRPLPSKQSRQPTQSTFLRDHGHSSAVARSRTSPSIPIDPATAPLLFPSAPRRPRARFEPGAMSEPGAQADASARGRVPSLFTSEPPLRDALETETSALQEENAQECLPFLCGVAGMGPDAADDDADGVRLPRLLGDEHVDFLKFTLEEMPAGYVGIDPSRPWVVYWALAGLRLLGQEVGGYAERVIQHMSAAQNPQGGMGGGHGHQSHVASTYAGVLSLAMLGTDALECIDRRSMWKWLGALKQASGGFAVSEGAEVDVRGAYCSMTIISLLNLPLELPADAPARSSGLTSFTDELPQWLSRCQTYEGGISGAPGAEAHGAYAFCVLACACILGDPRDVIPKTFDLPLLVAWLSARQYAPEGGLSGRTNKLVDGCYSHWVGGCWPIIEAALALRGSRGADTGEERVGLYSREGLVRYILSCCQAEEGGLRDKPSKLPDGYHSCYVLAGLSSALHHSRYEAEPGASDGSSHAFCWKNVDGTEAKDGQATGPEAVVRPVHPVFVVPYEAVEATRAWSVQKTGFS